MKRVLAPVIALAAAGVFAAPAAAQSLPDLPPLPGGNPIVVPIGITPIQQHPEIRLTDCRKYWVFNKEDRTYEQHEVCFGFQVIKP